MKIRADRRIGLLLGGAVLAVFAALVATVALPAADESLAVEDRELTAEELDGMHVFQSEGCWYCHTQYIRGTSLDSQLGTPTTPEALGGLSPVMLGVERMGPDLRNLRPQYRNAEALVGYLRDPSAGEPHTAMPSYAYLTRGELAALAQYILALQP